LSISTPLLSQGALLSHGLSHYTIEMVKGVSSDVMEIVEPAKEGYQLTLSINFDKIPHGKGLVILHFNDIQKILGT
jgi:actin related protein 2/3 complex subunit 2